MTDNDYALILAGGTGHRLWPLSNRRKPKLLLSIVGSDTLFRMTLDRIAPLYPLTRTLVITSPHLAAELREQAPQLADDALLLEPLGRGTAAAIGLGCVQAMHHHPAAVVACFPADHFIAHPARFRGVLEAAAAAAFDGHLVTLGIHPTRAASGFGYIESGAPLARPYADPPAYHVARFIEKPAPVAAAQLAAKPNCYWNSGILVGRAEVILGEMRRLMPTLHALVTDPQRRSRDAWADLPPESIDRGLLERTDKAIVLPVHNVAWAVSFRQACVTVPGAGGYAL